MSGSWGNCHYIRAGDTQIMIDAGQSAKRIIGCLTAAGEDAGQTTAILLTHAHHDHIAGVGVLARRFQLPVYATEGTWYEMRDIGGEIPPAARRVIDPEEKWRIGDLSLEAFPTVHDALESVGYVIRQGDKSLGVATDCGVFTRRMERALANLSLLALEANHDSDMLRNGKYPYYLKKRVAGIHGHLSNADAAAGLLKVLGEATKKVMLAHLSQENNTPEKALAAFDASLTGKGLTGDKRPAIWAAPRYQPSAWLEV
jgi:phosphoribosyl 1,2-cyclic phosphodiesterase